MNDSIIMKNKKKNLYHYKNYYLECKIFLFLYFILILPIIMRSKKTHNKFYYFRKKINKPFFDK